MKKRFMSLVVAAAVAGSELFNPVMYSEPGQSVVCTAASYEISENGLKLIKGYEGFSQYAFWDYHQWTIGYGTGVDKDAYPDGITEAEADRLLREVVIVYEKFVRNFLTKYNLSITQNQYDALVSLTYNMGNIWSNTSEVTIRDYLINGIENYTPQQITDAFKLWCKAGGVVLPGLVKRREAEAALFLSGADFSTVTEKGEKWRISSSTGVRLRSGADTNSPVIAVVPFGTTVVVEEKIESGGFTWGRTSYSGKEGWCVLEYADHISGEVETTVIPDDEKYDQWSVDSETGINLRYNFGMENRVLAVIPHETVITVYETKEAGDYTWGRTEYNGNVGWCVLNYAKKLGESPQPDRIYMKSYPSKTEYTAGELFDSRGMVVSAVYTDGHEENIEEYGCTGNTNIPGISTIHVEYMGMRCSFDITVWALPGDINQNGTLDPEDDYSLKTFILDSRENPYADYVWDINGDGVIDMFDSLHFKKEILNRNNE
ncbi:MAG: SH3 domain-containing protein [Oscillospiraceae bacterium]|nr:SH3 domain-containing protein [Oscillospiraceae bacterium]